MQECRKALKSGEPQRLKRVDLYGRNLIPMEGHGPPGPPVPMPMVNWYKMLTIVSYIAMCTNFIINVCACHKCFINANKIVNRK